MGSTGRLVFLLGIAGASQVTAQSPVFEVASVKPAVEPGRQPAFCIVPCSPGERLTVSGARVDFRYTSLFTLIVTAYRIQPYQLTGPDWMRSQRFDLAAKMPAGVSKEKLPEMLQALLAERFQLAIHRETREQQVYALVVGKNGPKLLPAAGETAGPLPETPGSRELYTPQGEGRILEDGGFVTKGGELGPMRGGRGPGGGMRFEFLSLTMPGLAVLLTPHLERPVVDFTNLKGSYYLVSENHRPDGGGARKGGPGEGGRLDADAPGSARPPDPFAEGLFAAIDKAGLKLEARKAPVAIIVVDRLAKVPTEN